MKNPAHETGGEWPWRFFDLASTILLALGPDGRVKYINRPGAEALGYPDGQILGREWVEHFLPERSRDEVRKVFSQISAGAANAPEQFENPVLCRDGSERIIAWRNAVARGHEGQIVAILSSGQDVTDQRGAGATLHEIAPPCAVPSRFVVRAPAPGLDALQSTRRVRRQEPRPSAAASRHEYGVDAGAQEHLRIGELHHRINNLLATVQAIARQTLREGSEQNEFLRRLNALGRAQALLQLDGGGSVDLCDLVAQELAPYPPDRISVHGPPVALDARTAELLALILHELGTNAVKYGGLSGAEGGLTVGWTVEADPAALLVLNWTERTEPDVRPPQRSGFGTHLIETSARAARGRVQVSFRPEGLRACLSIPLAHGSNTSAERARDMPAAPSSP